MKRSAIIGLAVLVGTVFYCTNPFDTRTPEEPDPGGSPSVGNSLQNSPNTVLDQIKLAFKDKNPQLYLDCFADPDKIGATFMFFPEQDEAARLGDWKLDNEKEYFRNLVNSAALDSVELTDSLLSEIQVTVDTFKMEFTYEITAEFITKTDRYQGRSILGLLRAQSNQLWYIYEWVDLRLGPDHSDSTWSTLKANYR